MQLQRSERKCFSEFSPRRCHFPDGTVHSYFTNCLMSSSHRKTQLPGLCRKTRYTSSSRCAVNHFDFGSLGIPVFVLLRSRRAAEEQYNSHQLLVTDPQVEILDLHIRALLLRALVFDKLLTRPARSLVRSHPNYARY